ncbi:hypothetical protein GWI33_022574 [Rhynchophorus ferrugineus]|uniref:Uncharacterized protein n=1 Tax=Rhynchophorus ferrugineus TaxID=354439 RepID=A0A834ML39_RHYFE|nr:hypothetical protein GWI33_022574 [Rhynchophorus ferrugineus]
MNPIQSVGKRNSQLARFMASVFWDAHGIIFIDYLEKGMTINSDYYGLALLDRLTDKIAEKWLHLKKQKVSPRQCTVSQVSENDVKNLRIGLRIASSSTVLYRFDLQ